MADLPENLPIELATAPDTGEFQPALQLATAAAARYLAAPHESSEGCDRNTALKDLDAPLCEHGVGAPSAVRELSDHAAASVPSSGGRYFDYATGGTTPAALAADWLTAALDQNARFWESSPLAVVLEERVLEWLKQLCQLPPDWVGSLTTGATMANFTGLACARHWWAAARGFDVDDQGMAGGPAPDVFSGDWLHPTTVKALSLLGFGRGTLRGVASTSGAIDCGGLDRALWRLRGAPAIVVANAGEVTSGRFDPIDDIARVCAEHGAWLHVDAAFGLMAALSPHTAHLVHGIARADSLASDAHKWLNVPYDCGFAYVRGGESLERVFGTTPTFHGPVGLNLAARSPENSRRARAIALWATLRAYGRSGYRMMVERYVELARRLAGQVDEAPDFERLAPTPLNVVAFRYRPPRAVEGRLNELNERLGKAMLADPNVFVGSTSRIDGRVGFRPVIMNWRTTEADVDAVLPTVRAAARRIVRCDSAA